MSKRIENGLSTTSGVLSYQITLVKGCVPNMKKFFLALFSLMLCIFTLVTTPQVIPHMDEPYPQPIVSEPPANPGQSDTAQPLDDEPDPEDDLF